MSIFPFYFNSRVAGEILPAFYDDVAVMLVELHNVAGAVKLLTSNERRTRTAKRLDHDVVLAGERYDVFRGQCHRECGRVFRTDFALFAELLCNRFQTRLLRQLQQALHLFECTGFVAAPSDTEGAVRLTYLVIT